MASFIFNYMGILDEQPVVMKFWKLYHETFGSLYLYCARRATTKPVIAFIMKSLYENAFDEMKSSQEIVLLDLYKWAYEFFAAQSQPGAAGGQVKRVHDFRDVYEVKTDSGSRAIKREQLLENFYTQLSFKEREVLWLTFFEELSASDRAIVMSMSEEECTKFYYEVLKKSKEIVAQATEHQRGLRALASYFGSVASLLKKARSHEDITVDQEIFISLKDLFMEQFARMGVVPVPPQRSVPGSAQEQQVQREQMYTPPKAQPVEVSADEDLDEREDFANEGFAPNLWRKLQGAVLLLLIIGGGAVGYFQFLDEDARVKRLLGDERVEFSDEFSGEQKESFAREALLYFTRGRDYTFAKIARRGKMVQVMFDIADGVGREAFLIYPEPQKFDYRFKWQPKEYRRVEAA